MLKYIEQTTISSQFYVRSCASIDLMGQAISLISLHQFYHSYSFFFYLSCLARTLTDVPCCVKQICSPRKESKILLSKLCFISLFKQGKVKVQDNREVGPFF